MKSFYYLLIFKQCTLKCCLPSDEGCSIAAKTSKNIYKYIYFLMKNLQMLLKIARIISHWQKILFFMNNNYYYFDNNCLSRSGVEIYQVALTGVFPGALIHQPSKVVLILMQLGHAWACFSMQILQLHLKPVLLVLSKNFWLHSWYYLGDGLAWAVPWHCAFCHWGGIQVFFTDQYSTSLYHPVLNRLLPDGETEANLDNLSTNRNT